MVLHLIERYCSQRAEINRPLINQSFKRLFLYFTNKRVVDLSIAILIILSKILLTLINITTNITKDI